MGGKVSSRKGTLFIPYLSSLVPPMFGSVCRSKEDSSAVSRARSEEEETSRTLTIRDYSSPSRRCSHRGLERFAR